MNAARPESATEALETARRQRVGIAARIRLPRWYWGVYAISLLTAFLAPAFIGSDGSWLVLVSTGCIVVLGFVDVVVSGASGVRVRLHDSHLHPSLRWPLRGLLAAIAVGSGATWIALAEVSPVASALCGLAAVVAILAFRQRVLAAVRRDIASGAGA